MPQKLSAVAVLAIVAWQGGGLSAQTPGKAASLDKAGNRIEITLERNASKSGDAWQVVDPATIFDSNDHVRFRFRTNFDGYLYVLNHSTSGKDELLYPRQDTGSKNRVKSGQDYKIPESEAYFRIAGPAGHDVLYWMLSPVELPGYPAATEREAPKRQFLLTPRCDDAILKARGECLDSTAGAREIPDMNDVPQTLPEADNSSDMIFMRQDKKSVVASASPLSGPVVYEFRISHR